jgi:hypothetical protein
MSILFYIQMSYFGFVICFLTTIINFYWFDLFNNTFYCVYSLFAFYDYKYFGLELHKNLGRHFKFYNILSYVFLILSFVSSRYVNSGNHQF